MVSVSFGEDKLLGHMVWLLTFGVYSDYDCSEMQYWEEVLGGASPARWQIFCQVHK